MIEESNLYARAVGDLPSSSPECIELRVVLHNLLERVLLHAHDLERDE